MKLDEFRFLIHDVDTGYEAVLCFNDLYGYHESRNSGEENIDTSNIEGILVRYNHMPVPGNCSYIPSFFEGMLICANTSFYEKGCNDKLLIRYIPDNRFIEYPLVKLEEFRFRIKDLESGFSSTLTFNDLIADEYRKDYRRSQGVCIRRNSENKKAICEEIAGKILVGNSGYDCLGPNPHFSIIYAGFPEKHYFRDKFRPDERIPEIMSTLEIVWKMSPDIRLGQLISNIIGERNLFSIEDEKLLYKLRDYMFNGRKNF